MASYELIREGEATEDGRYIVPGAITWHEDRPLSVVSYENGQPQVVGAVTNLRREGDSVWGDWDGDAGALTVDVDDVVYDEDSTTHLWRFTQARIVLAWVADKADFPWRER